MLGSLRHCIPAANRGHRCHLRSNTTTSLLHVRYIRLYGPEPYALWLLSPPAASPLLPSPSPAVPDLQVGSCAGYPARSFACPAPANLREAETGASVASFSACAGNGGVCGTAAELPPQLRDLPITQAVRGYIWVQAGERRKTSRGEQIEDEARGKRGCDIVKRDSRSARGAGREQRRVTLQRRRR